MYLEWWFGIYQNEPRLHVGWGLNQSVHTTLEDEWRRGISCWKLSRDRLGQSAWQTRLFYLNWDQGQDRDRQFWRWLRAAWKDCWWYSFDPRWQYLRRYGNSDHIQGQQYRWQHQMRFDWWLTKPHIWVVSFIFFWNKPCPAPFYFLPATGYWFAPVAQSQAPMLLPKR
jgi:hypothetical protein